MNLSRWLAFVRLSAVVALVASVLSSTLPATAADKSWQFFESADPANNGRRVARIDLGVPETDNIQVRGECKAPAIGAPTPSLTFGADIGDLANDAATELRFTGGGFEHSVPGKVVGKGAEVGIAGVRVEPGLNDPLWDALKERASLEYLVPGYSFAKLPLKGGRRQIGNFIDACKSYEKNEPAKVADTGIKLAAGPSGSGGVDEKEAFEAAKELGTIEAWEAFLENFPEGFRADLARAYVKRIGTEGVDKATPLPTPPSDTAEKKPEATPASPAPADISLSITSAGSCEGGRNCSVTVTATNTGEEPFTRPLTIATSVAPGGAELQGTGTPPFSCEGAGGGAICSQGSTDIAPGQSLTLPMTFTMPRNAGGQVTTCASIAWGGVPAALQPADVQRKLNELGFEAGPVDGQPGRQTEAAIRAFQQSAGIQETGEIDLPLLLALFAPQGEGDADPVNDQACTGAAVTAAPPFPAAYQGPPQPTCPLGQVIGQNGECGCPSSVPVWTGTSCIPRLTRNCNRGRVYDKRQKLCVCPSSRPHWYNNRCHAQFDNCPGDSVRVGDKCLKENDPGFAARPGRGPGQGPGGQAGCGGNSIRIGNVCVNVSNAPVFGGRPGRGPRGNTNADTCPGDSVRNAQGICVKENDAGPGGGTQNNFFYSHAYTYSQTVPGGGQTATPQGGQNTGNLSLLQQDCSLVGRCAYVQVKGSCRRPLIKEGTFCMCPSKNQVWKGSKCVAVDPKGGKCPTGQAMYSGFGCVSTKIIQVWNQEQKLCGTDPRCAFFKNPSTPNTCKAPLYFDDNSCWCPKNTTWNGTTCVGAGGSGQGGSASDPLKNRKCPNLNQAWTGSGCRTCPSKQLVGDNNNNCSCWRTGYKWDGKYCQPTCKPPAFASEGVCKRTRTPPKPPAPINPAQTTCPVGKATNLNCTCPAGTTSRKLAAGGSGKVTGQICVQGGGQATSPPPVQKCLNNLVRLPNGQCGCTGDAVLSGSRCVMRVQPKPQPTHVVNCAGGQRAGSGCQCPAGQAAKLVSARKTPDGSTTKNYTCVAVGIQCGPGTHAVGGSCVSDKPPAGTVSKEIFCQPGTGLVPQNGKCGCPPGKQWNGKVCAGQQQPAQPQQPAQQQQPQQTVACSGGGQVVNGRCVCPANRPRLDNGRCKKASGVNNFMQQLQQQQNQPQQQQQQQNQPRQQGLSPQQQQQLQQGLQQLNKIFSDRRLKRDVKLVATRADGLKLYSFRYLWDEQTYVGVMAQDLLGDPVRAAAVSLHASGYYMVDYGKLRPRETTSTAGRTARP